MRTSMFSIVAFFVINANASPAPQFYQEAFAVPAGKFLLLSYTTFWSIRLKEINI